MNKPSILLIMADQLNPNFTFLGGDETANMPAIRKLADNGVVFSNSYCNNPLCTPSRASMMSGRLISSIECSYDNGSEFSCEIPTMAHMLRGNGYRTVLSGKMHFIGPDQLHGFEKRITGEIYPTDFACTPSGWDLGAPTHEKSRFIDNGPSEWNRQIAYDEKVHSEATCELRRLVQDETPFFMTVSYSHPHNPYKAPSRYFRHLEGKKIRMPDSGDVALEQLDEYNRYLRWAWGLDKPLEPEQILENRRSYYAMMNYVDDKVAEIMDILETSGRLDDTVVIFTSDHGDMMGEKGMWDKRTYFEDSLRIPLIFHCPQRFKQGILDTEVSLLDLFPTLIDISGSPWDRYLLEGRSLVDGLNAGRLETNTIVAEYFGETIKYPFVAAIRDRHKFVHFPMRRELDLFFDLENDPGERKNAINAPSYSKKIELLSQAISNDDDHRHFCKRIQESHRNRNLIKRFPLAGTSH